MYYRNKRTGKVIEINGIITGDTWELIKDDPKEGQTASKPPVKAVKPKKGKK